MRILIVRLSALGDVVSGLHVLSTIRARLCSARIGWLVEDRFARLVAGHPQLDEVHVYPRSRWWRAPGLVRGLRRARYDLALDLQGNLKSGVLARLSGARRRAGLDVPLAREGNRLFVPERVPPPAAPHRLDAYHALLDAVFGPGEHAPAVLPARPADHGSIVFHPGTSAFGSFKRWPAAHFAALGDRLHHRLGLPVTVTAGPGERKQAEEVTRRMETPASVVEPESIGALIDYLAGARLVVASDTGPAHLAGAAGVPTIAMFGPKDPAVHAPAGPRVRAVRAGYRCSPCALRFCPEPLCMAELSVDQVERTALELLS